VFLQTCKGWTTGMLSLFMIDFHNGMNCVGSSDCYLMAYTGHRIGQRWRKIIFCRNQNTGNSRNVSPSTSRVCEVRSSQ
jgi:hypothetical protein